MADLLNEKDQLINLENLVKEEKFSEALELAEQVLNEFPESFQVEFMYARILRASRKLDEAEAILSKLLAIHDNHLNLLLEMGSLCLDLNRLDPAFDYYNKALFIDPFNTQAKEAMKTIRDKFSQSGTEPPGVGMSVREEREKWKADTLPEVEMKQVMGEVEDSPESYQEDQITEDSISIEDEPIKEMKPSIPGVDEAYVSEDEIKVETREKKMSRDVEESLTADPDFLPSRKDKTEIEVTTDDVADLFVGEPEKKKPDSVSTRKAFREEVRGPGGEGDEFITESAAELYVSQGLYDEALYIYEKLNQANKKDKFDHKIQELKSKSICQKKIQALSAFLNIIQKRGG